MVYGSRKDLSAPMLEQVDKTDLKSVAYCRRQGASPCRGTIFY